MNLFTRDTFISILKLNNDIEVLFSYGVAVAGFIPNQGYFKTNIFFCTNTEKHIKDYIKNAEYMTLNQGAIDHLLIG